MVDIKVDKTAEQALINFTDGFIKSILNGVEEGCKKTAEAGKRQFRKFVDDDSLPGPSVSEGWRQFKISKGFVDARHQRFGRGDSRSYYQNVKVISATGKLNWFVGVVEGTRAYDNEGRIRSDVDLSDIAEDLNERWPIWNEILDKLIGKATTILAKSIIRNLRKLCPNLEIIES